jgi:hypothetical protein
VASVQTKKMMGAFACINPSRHFLAKTNDTIQKVHDGWASPLLYCHTCGDATVSHAGKVCRKYAA